MLNNGQLYRRAGHMRATATRVDQYGTPLLIDAAGLFHNESGEYGYTARLSGAWVCYSCGHLCDPDLHDEGAANE